MQDPITASGTRNAGGVTTSDIANSFKQALALHQQGKLAEAEAGYRRVLDSAPAHVDALHLLGVVNQQLGDLPQAVELIRRSIALNPDRPAPYSNLGIALHRLERYQEALASFDQALSRKPDYVEALLNRGMSRQGLKQHEAALADFDEALRLRPTLVDGHLRRGNTLRELNRHAQALVSYERVLELAPGHVEALVSRGNALQRLRRHEEALECYERALAINPALHQVQNNRGSALRDLKRYSEAADAFARLESALPAFDYAASNRFHSQLYSCDWRNYDQDVRRITAMVTTGQRADVPFSFLSICDAAQAQLQCAQRYVADRFPPSGAPAATPRDRGDGKIRLAYLSSDFREHAVAYLMAGLFERHDRERFHLTAISFGPDQDDGMRRRLSAAFDDFIDVRQKSDQETAALIRELDIHIAIDLNGFTIGNRAGILAQRPAPIQVNYLGYPGTMGADYIDYLIADAHIIPAGSQRWYAEQVVTLPDCYQVNDASRAISPDTATREQSGLPAQGFVFCCFNNNYKINPETFDSWMRLLRQVPGSVLWLIEDNADATRNLRAEANLRGVAPERLVFAPRKPLNEHLARHRLADLFLDTLPYNAHTTASDALWAGLPVLTCSGQSFAGRVAGSLLLAVGLDELVCKDREAYEAQALRLATSPAELDAARAKLARNRERAPLFDTDRFRRHLEFAFEQMWRRHQSAQAPAAFIVPAIP